MRLAVMLLTVAPVLLVAGCGGAKPDLAGDGKPVVFASIQPVAFLVDRIAGDAVTVRTLVRPGQDPHTYEPTPAQVQAAWVKLAERTGDFPVYAFPAHVEWHQDNLGIILRNLKAEYPNIQIVFMSSRTLAKDMARAKE